MITPRQSQQIMTWCIESAIGLIFDGIKFLGKRTGRGAIGEYILTETRHLDISQRDVGKMVYELKRRKYIENVDGDSVILTNKAKIKIIDRISLANKWDGKYRFVSFDIPEIKRLNRNNFRRAIKRMGFVQIQKSLWVSDRNIGNFVELAADEYHVSDFVAYFVVDNSNVDHHIKAILSNSQK